MVHITSAVATRDIGYAGTPARKRFSASELFKRIVNAMITARQRQVERDIGRYLRDNGGKLTDDVERAIERRFLSSI